MVIVDDTTAKMNNVILNVQINQNNKVKIKEIVYEGNQLLSEMKLTRLMKHTNKKDYKYQYE